MQSVKQAVQHYLQHGYAIIPKFISPASCEKAVNQIDRLINQFQPDAKQFAVFDTNKQSHYRHKYFLDSADKVSFFYQQQAIKQQGLVVDKHQAINKIGHALHEHNELFKHITYQKVIADLCASLCLEHPLVVQSMAILKPPRIGGPVTLHQDSTFLYDYPESLIGFWMPLQDAGKDNGCLWGIPGTHQGKLYKRSKVINGVAQMEIIEDMDVDQGRCVALEMERGSLVFFSGRFLHKSQANRSAKSRYAYTWHLIDGRSQWSKENWLQRKAFPVFEVMKEEL